MDGRHKKTLTNIQRERKRERAVPGQGGSVGQSFPCHTATDERGSLFNPPEGQDHSAGEAGIKMAKPPVPGKLFLCKSTPQEEYKGVCVGGWWYIHTYAFLPFEFEIYLSDK